MSNIPTTPLDDNDSIPESPFEKIKQIDPDGNEFWSARDLMPLLEYASWQNFRNVLLKAQTACEKSGNDPDAHFMQATRMMPIGTDALREMKDIHLSRYGCYLVVQNADPSKKAVAQGQTYIAVQTYRQGSATPANHGFHGLYNGLTTDDIRKRKNIEKHENILDKMSDLELAAHYLHISMAEEKIRTQNIQGKDNANKVRYEAGVVVRRAIAELGGEMPEDLPTADSIKKLERAEKKRLESGKKKSDE